jgi:HAMP domain-containing protein
MPEVPVKEVRLPELRLPEISREEILRTLSDVRRPDLGDLAARLPGRVPSAEVETGRQALGRLVARFATLAALVPAVELPRVADILSRLVARVRPAPKPTLRDRLGVKWGRPRVRVVVAALIVAALAIALTRAARAVRRRATAGVTTDAEGLEIEPDSGPAGDVGTDVPRIEGIAIVEVIEVDAIVEATRIASGRDAQGLRAETAPWEDDGVSDPGDGDGMPVFDETQTAG